MVCNTDNYDPNILKG